MNLFDCRVPYFAVPNTTLELRTKSSLQIALTIYCSKSPAMLEDDATDRRSMSPYQRRVRSELRRELLHADVLLEADDQLQLVPLDMEEDRSIAKDRIVLPSRTNFDVLSMVSLKVLLALYSLNRYSRTPFQLRLTRAELASHAAVAVRRVGDALKQLAANRLITAQKQWKAAGKITLLDPESGVELYYIGDFYRRRLDAIPVCCRYEELLRNFDPRDHLRNIRGPVSGYTVYCPFCQRSMRGEARFRFDSTDEGDHWTCFGCRRSGTSARLWTKLFGFDDRIDWRQMLDPSIIDETYIPNVPVMPDHLPDIPPHTSDA